MKAEIIGLPLQKKNAKHATRIVWLNPSEFFFNM